MANDNHLQMVGFAEWLESLPDGVPCDHRGCLSHISHPCESCGRIGGKRLTPLTPDAAEGSEQIEKIIKEIASTSGVPAEKIGNAGKA